MSDNNAPEEYKSQWRTSPAMWEKLKPYAREMRHAPTPAESKLWRQLSRKQVMGLRFRRQHSILQFIVDFYCAKAKLVIEIDGRSHEETVGYDAVRSECLESLGLGVIRFTNIEVMNNLSGVVAAIEAAVVDQMERD